MWRTCRPKNCGIIRHLLPRRRRLLLRRLLDPQVLHIAPSKHNVLVQSIICSHSSRTGLAVLGAHGTYIFESDCGIFGIDFVECAYVADV